MKITPLPPPKTAAGKRAFKEYSDAVKRGEKILEERRKNGKKCKTAKR